MIEALVLGLEGGGDNGGYILGMCSGHPLVASYSSPNFFSLSLWSLKKFSIVFSLCVYKLKFSVRLSI